MKFVKKQVSSADEAIQVSFDITKSPEGEGYWNNQLMYLNSSCQTFVKPSFEGLEDFAFRLVRVSYAIKETGKPCYIDCVYREADDIRKELKKNKFFTDVQVGEIPK